MNFTILLVDDQDEIVSQTEIEGEADNMDNLASRAVEFFTKNLEPEVFKRGTSMVVLDPHPTCGCHSDSEECCGEHDECHCGKEKD